MLLRRLMCWFGIHTWLYGSVMDRDEKGRLYSRGLAECEDCGAIKWHEEEPEAIG